MCKEIRHHVLTGELWGKGKTWSDLSTGMYLLMIQSRLYQLAMLAVSAIDTQEMRQACSTKVPTRARDMEVRSGIKSAARCAKEGVVGLLELCSDWPSLHSALAARGMRYEKRAGGAVIVLGDVALKASSVGRPFSLSHLQKRFGLFQPGGDAVVFRAPEALRPELPDWHVICRRGVNMAKVAERLPKGCAMKTPGASKNCEPNKRLSGRCYASKIGKGVVTNSISHAAC